MFEQINESLIVSFTMVLLGMLFFVIGVSVLRLLWALRRYHPPTETFAKGCEHLQKGPGVKHGMVRGKDGMVKGVTSIDHWERVKYFL